MRTSSFPAGRIGIVRGGRSRAFPRGGISSAPVVGISSDPFDPGWLAKARRTLGFRRTPLSGRKTAGASSTPITPSTPLNLSRAGEWEPRDSQRQAPSMLPTSPARASASRTTGSGCLSPLLHQRARAARQPAVGHRLEHRHIGQREAQAGDQKENPREDDHKRQHPQHEEICL